MATTLVLPAPGDPGNWGAAVNIAIGVVRDAADAAQATATAGSKSAATRVYARATFR